MKTKGFPNVTKPEDQVKCEASDEFALTNYAKKEEKKEKATGTKGYRTVDSLFLLGSWRETRAGKRQREDVQLEP